MSPLLALLLPVALAEPAPERTWPMDSPVVRAAAQGAWVRLPRTPFRSWFACGGEAAFRRGPETTDPLARVCAEARDLGRVVQVLTVRVERVALGETRVVVDGPLPERDPIARRYFRAVDGLLRSAADPKDPLYELWVASTDAAARLDRARSALAATTDPTAGECARRAAWLRAADPQGWQSPARARVALTPDPCAAGLATELVAAGDDPTPLHTAVVARVEASSPPATADVEGLRASLPSWPEPLRAALTADLARWDAATAARAAAAHAAHEAALAALPEAQRACRASTAAALTSGPTPAAAALDPAGNTGRTAAWPLPLALWIPPTSARSGYVEDGRGGVAWTATLPAGVPLTDDASRPTTLVTGTLRAEELRGPDGRLRVVPALDVRCVPSVELPPPLRPAWSPIDGWAFPPAP